MIAKLAGDPIFAKFCHDALQLILRHPQIYILQFCTGGIGKYVEIRASSLLRSVYVVHSFAALAKAADDMQHQVYLKYASTCYGLECV